MSASAERVTAGRAALDTILGRPVHDMQLELPLMSLGGKRVLVTGAAGSIGTGVLPYLADCTIWATDRDKLDVTAGGDVLLAFDTFRPDIVLHLAGAKHAPAGEENPWEAMRVNAEGTWNVLAAAAATGCERVVTASTCKACNPETAYGASKLLAERMTLNAGGSVARFYNVVESQGNVFEIWEAIPEPNPIPYTMCTRYFLAMREAVGLLLWSAILPPRRYTVWPGDAREMGYVAADTYPSRAHVRIPRRRGDREREPLLGTHEEFAQVDECRFIRQIISPHD